MIGFDHVWRIAYTDTDGTRQMRGEVYLSERHAVDSLTIFPSGDPSVVRLPIAEDTVRVVAV